MCENNGVRRITGMKRIDRRKMDHLREELGRFKRAGHVERMEEQSKKGYADGWKELETKT